MVKIRHDGDGRFIVTLTGAALDALTERTRENLSAEEAAEYGDPTFPPTEVLRDIIREGLGLSVNEAADDHADDLDDGMPF